MFNSCELNIVKQKFKTPTLSGARYHVHELNIKMAQTDTQIEATSI